MSMTLEYPAASALDTRRPAQLRAATHRRLTVSARLPRAALAGPLTGLICQFLLCAALGLTVGLGHIAWIVGMTCSVIMNLTLSRGLSFYRSDGLGPAGWVTLARATLAAGVASLVAQSFSERTPVVMLVAMATLALTLDAVDGYVARRTGTTSALGARFDGEVDAFLILVLSVYVTRSLGAWVLVSGAARYAFFLAGWPMPWLRAQLPARYWRKVAAAAQGIVLTAATAEILPPTVTRAALLAALGLLVESFGRDVWWLRSHRRTRPAPSPAVPTDLHKRGRISTVRGAGLTALAVLVVWAALVAPSPPRGLALTGFVRVPLEGVLPVGIAVGLGPVSRRLLAVAAGPVLAMLVALKLLDFAFFAAFARPFDLVGDSGNVGTGLETLRAALGATKANLIVLGAVALALALVAVMTLAMFRLVRVAADHRRWSLGACTGLAVVWLLCWASGTRLLPGTPLASLSAAGYVVHELRTVQADLHDEGVFAKQIGHDRFRDTSGFRLLTGLRGEDVLLVFVESYGRVSVEGSSFSLAIDALLREGTRELRNAGFSARSAFLTAPGFGGISWLAHSTLQAGVWANSQRRYDQLVGTHRLTLSEAFGRAGWRTINFAPADDRSWPEGSSFYHYDKLYDRRDMGYHGPGFNYAPMPDQYMFAALERLELARAHRRPLFAEVDTVSSHMPWDRIPRLIPWNDVGDGSVFRRIAIDREPASFWWHPALVRTAYARSLEYSLRTLISFVQRYRKRNVALVVVGDEQPLAIVSGMDVSHDVPISIIAHDPRVLDRIAGWRWQAGLLPTPRAPVWRMSAFRDRLLDAFGSQATTPAGEH